MTAIDRAARQQCGRGTRGVAPSSPGGDGSLHARRCMATSAGPATGEATVSVAADGSAKRTGAATAAVLARSG